MFFKLFQQQGNGQTHHSERAIKAKRLSTLEIRETQQCCETKTGFVVDYKIYLFFEVNSRARERKEMRRGENAVCAAAADLMAKDSCRELFAIAREKLLINSTAIGFDEMKPS